MASTTDGPLVGVLALQGAFEEHQTCLEAVGCRTRQVNVVVAIVLVGRESAFVVPPPELTTCAISRTNPFLVSFVDKQTNAKRSSHGLLNIGCFQVRTIQELDGLDGIVLPGGESTAMGLIGTATTDINSKKSMWDALKEFSSTKPTWGTCAGMILLAQQCVGASAVIENGQALIGGVDILVCRNYFGSQVSSFEMATEAPPGIGNNKTEEGDEDSFPGVFIRAPAILSAGPGVTVLGKVVATPCRQAAVVLQELENKIRKGEHVIQMQVVDALERRSSQDITYKVVVKKQDSDIQEEKKQQENSVVAGAGDSNHHVIELPGAADGTNAREVISAVRKDQLLCTAFHPELTEDYRWHEYFANMVKESMRK